MKIALGVALVLAGALRVGASAHAADARHYDCTKAGNANKAACKGAATAIPAAAPAAPMAKAAPAAPIAKAAPPMVAATSAKHYDCSKAGNVNKTACKGVAPAPAAAQAPVAAQAPRPAAAPMTAPTHTVAAAPVQTPSGSPRIVEWTEKNGKVVHYDCTKAGNFNKKACKQ